MSSLWGNSPAVVLGSTGQLGLFVIAELLEAGREVIAVTRRAPAQQSIAIERLERCSIAQLSGRLEAVSHSGDPSFALVSCGPAALARQVLSGTRASPPGTWGRLVVVGTTSTSSKRDSPDAGERALIADIDQALEDITRLCGECAIPLTVLHPTLIYGCGMDENLSRVYRWIRSWGFAPLAANAQGRRQPLHVADLARTVARAVLAETAPGLESPVCGGSTLSYEAMVRKLFDAVGRPARLWRVPGIAAPVVAGLSALVPGVGRINAEMFRRQSSDLVFDDGPARAVLDHAPRDFAPTSGDFSLPEPIARIARALA